MKLKLIVVEFLESLSLVQLHSLLVFMVILIVVALFSLVTSCNLFKHYPDDNPLEEIVEEVIEQKTGLDLDLSPYSQED